MKTAFAAAWQFLEYQVWHVSTNVHLTVVYIIISHFAVMQATVWKALGEEVVKELKIGKANWEHGVRVSGIDGQVFVLSPMYVSRQLTAVTLDSSVLGCSFIYRLNISLNRRICCYTPLWNNECTIIVHFYVSKTWFIESANEMYRCWSKITSPSSEPLNCTRFNQEILDFKARVIVI